MHLVFVNYKVCGQGDFLDIAHVDFLVEIHSCVWMDHTHCCVWMDHSVALRSEINMKLK